MAKCPQEQGCRPLFSELVSKGTSQAIVRLDRKMLRELHDEEDAKVPAWMRYSARSERLGSKALGGRDDKEPTVKGNLGRKVSSNPFAPPQTSARSKRLSACSPYSRPARPRKRINVEETAALLELL